jgi:hypothetical protein
MVVEVAETIGDLLAAGPVEGGAPATILATFQHTQ